MLRGVEWRVWHNVPVLRGAVSLLPLYLYCIKFVGMVFYVVHPYLRKVAVHEGASLAVSHSVAQASPGMDPSAVVQIKHVAPNISVIPLAYLANPSVRSGCGWVILSLSTMDGVDYNRIKGDYLGGRLGTSVSLKR